MKRLKDFNVSVHGKWVWRVMEERECQWFKVKSARHGEEWGRLRFSGNGWSIWFRNLNQIRSG